MNPSWSVPAAVKAISHRSTNNNGSLATLRRGVSDHKLPLTGTQPVAVQATLGHVRQFRKSELSPPPPTLAVIIHYSPKTHSDAKLVLTLSAQSSMHRHTFSWLVPHRCTNETKKEKKINRQVPSINKPPNIHLPASQNWSWNYSVKIQIMNLNHIQCQQV
jgi:hypothetical protein